MDDVDQVFIKNLSLLLSVGIYPSERSKPQRVIINASFDVMPHPQDRPEAIQDVVSYETAIQEIKAIAKAKHYDLLEVLAEDIIHKLSRNNKIRKIFLSLEKPDIFEEAESVGITMTRVFQA